MAGRCNQAQISEIRNVIICKLHYRLSRVCNARQLVGGVSSLFTLLPPNIRQTQSFRMKVKQGQKVLQLHACQHCQFVYKAVFSKLISLGLCDDIFFSFV